MKSIWYLFTLLPAWQVAMLGASLGRKGICGLSVRRDSHLRCEMCFECVRCVSRVIFGFVNWEGRLVGSGHSMRGLALATFWLTQQAGLTRLLSQFGHGLSNFGIGEERTLQLSIALGPNNSMSSLTCSGMSGHATVARRFGFSD